MRHTVLSACLLLSACLRPLPADHADEDPAGCPGFCGALERMQCPGWRGSHGRDETFGTPDDLTCERACEAVLASSPYAVLHLECTAAAQSCAEADKCFE